MALVDLRKSAGMTQQQLADRLEVDQTAVSKWEKGINPPLLKYRKKLCNIFHCTEADLEQSNY